MVVVTFVDDSNPSTVARVALAGTTQAAVLAELRKLGVDPTQVFLTYAPKASDPLRHVRLRDNDKLPMWLKDEQTITVHGPNSAQFISELAAATRPSTGGRAKRSRTKRTRTKRRTTKRRRTPGKTPRVLAKWVAHVQSTHAKHGGTYKEAMQLASRTWKA